MARKSFNHQTLIKLLVDIILVDIILVDIILVDIILVDIISRCTHDLVLILIQNTQNSEYLVELVLMSIPPLINYRT